MKFMCLKSIYEYECCMNKLISSQLRTYVCMYIFLFLFIIQHGNLGPLLKPSTLTVKQCPMMKSLGTVLADKIYCRLPLLFHSFLSLEVSPLTTLLGCFVGTRLMYVDFIHNFWRCIGAQLCNLHPFFLVYSAYDL